MGMVSLYPRALYLGAKNCCPLGMRPKFCLGATGKRKGLDPCWESSHDFQSHYTDRAITEHMQSK